MPDAVRPGIRRLGDAIDYTNNAGSGTDGYPLTYDHDTGTYTLVDVVGAHVAAGDPHTQYLLVAGTRDSTGAQRFTVGLITGKIYPASDSTNAFGLFRANATTQDMYYDSTNGWVGFGIQPESQFHIAAAGSGATARTVLQVNSTVVNSAFLIYNTDTGNRAGTGMLFGAGASPSSGYIGGVTSQRMDDASNSRTSFRVLSNGSLTGTDSSAVFFLEGSSSVVGIRANGALDVYNTASVSSELVANGTFTSSASWTFGTGWAYDAGGSEADHTPGSTAALEQNIGVVAGAIYRLRYVIRNWTVGTVTPSIGGTDATKIGTNGTQAFQYLKAVSTANLKFTPSSDFDGSIDTVTVVRVLAGDIAAHGSFVGAGTSGMKVADNGYAGFGGNVAPNSPVDVTGTIQADGLRLDVTPAAETPTATHTITISANGTDYKLLCVPA